MTIVEYATTERKIPGKVFDSLNFVGYIPLLLAGGVPERSKGADCKSAGTAFEGSNPSPSTKRLYVSRPVCWLAEKRM